MFEQRTPWQRAWAKFRTSESKIDYVRPSGAGSESLLLNAGQLDRRNRSWLRVILDEFGAADIIVPIARIERQWPGGPVVGNFRRDIMRIIDFLAALLCAPMTRPEFQQ